MFKHEMEPMGFFDNAWPIVGVLLLFGRLNSSGMSLPSIVERVYPHLIITQ